ncbi:hypothetical protein CEK25_013595 [Fusarium fujikuroi]|nr:hypothetical protein CEK25_013595 [Fusarium fujikuroi]
MAKTPFFHVQTKLDISFDLDFLLTARPMDLSFRSMPIFLTPGIIFADVARSMPIFHIDQGSISCRRDARRSPRFHIELLCDPWGQTQSWFVPSDDPVSCAWRVPLCRVNQNRHRAPKATSSEAWSEPDTNNPSPKSLQEVITDVTEEDTSPNPSHSRISKVLSSQTDVTDKFTLPYSYSPHRVDGSVVPNRSLSEMTRVPNAPSVLCITMPAL